MVVNPVTTNSRKPSTCRQSPPPPATSHQPRGRPPHANLPDKHAPLYIFSATSSPPFNSPIIPPWLPPTSNTAWFVWVEGGFHRLPAVLGLYLVQLALSLVWYPVVFSAGAIRLGLVLCATLFGAPLGCARAFQNMNPITGDLVKPCLAWALLLAVANVRLVYQ